MCDSPIPLTEASGGGGECNHCPPIKPEEGSPWLCPLSRQGVGGAAVARSGITSPGRQEPDPGAHPTLLFAALGSSDADRRASVLEVQGDSQCCCCWEDCSQKEWWWSLHVLPPFDPISSLLDATNDGADIR